MRVVRFVLALVAVSATNALALAGLWLLFVLGGLSLTGWYLFTQIDIEDTSTTSNTRSNNPSRVR